MFFWPSFFLGGLGCLGQKNKRFQETSGFFAWPPSAAGPNNHYFLEDVWFFGLGTPGLQKATWLTNHFEILIKM